MERKFPRYLTNPYQVLMFEVDELMVILFNFVFWLVFGNFFLITLFLCPYLYSRAKKKYPRGFLRHLLFFAGLLKLHGYPHYFQKVFIR
ncbi:MAG: type IV conjugative transfer system protein TraL [Syntrophorhabdaceae bacterium]|nr:type IV conjugative transfer system protein TraL [Syntrophorhabdaceae bacterium]